MGRAGSLARERRISAGARLAAVFVGGPLAAIVSGALVGVGAITAGLILGGVTMRVVRSELLGVARVWVRDRTPTASESTLLGLSLAGFAVIELASGLFMRVVWRAADTPLTLEPSFVFLFLAFTSAVLARGTLRTARLLRRVPGLLEPGETARAVAVRSNGFAPSRSLAMLIATDERLIWVEHGGARSLACTDVDGVESDSVRGDLRLRLAGGDLVLSPVPRREMKVLGKLLAPARSR